MANSISLKVRRLSSYTAFQNFITNGKGQTNMMVNTQGGQAQPFSDPSDTSIYAMYVIPRSGGETPLQYFVADTVAQIITASNA
jgi:hypothetical protein